MRAPDKGRQGGASGCSEAERGEEDGEVVAQTEAAGEARSR